MTTCSNDDCYGLLRMWKPLLIVLGRPPCRLVQPDLGTTMMIVLVSCTLVFWPPQAVTAGGGRRGAGVFGVLRYRNDDVRETPEPHTTIVRRLSNRTRASASRACCNQTLM